MKPVPGPLVVVSQSPVPGAEGATVAVTVTRYTCVAPGSMAAEATNPSATPLNDELTARPGVTAAAWTDWMLTPEPNCNASSSVDRAGPAAAALAHVTAYPRRT